MKSLFFRKATAPAVPALVVYLAASASTSPSGMSPPSPCFAMLLRQMLARMACVSFLKQIE